MSTTVSPSSEGSNSSSSSKTNSSKSSAAPGTLIKLSLDSITDLRYSAVQVAGDPPLDSPMWYDHTTMPAARRNRPLTMRFVADTRLSRCPLKVEKQLRSALWEEISKLLRQADVPVILPSIIFDESTMPDKVGKGLIDLVFAAPDGFQKVYRTLLEQLRPIQIVDLEGGMHVYKCVRRTNSLDGSIIPVECVGLPIDALDAAAVMAAFEDVAAPLGRVLGVVKIVVKSKEWDAKEQETGITRFYLQFAPKKMTTPWKETILALPTQFVCNGVPYTMRYSGVDLHTEKVLSTDFSIPLKHATANSSGSSSASDKRSRTATDATSDSSSAANKKARRSNE